MLPRTLEESSAFPDPPRGSSRASDRTNWRDGSRETDRSCKTVDTRSADGGCCRGPLRNRQRFRIRREGQVGLQIGPTGETEAARLIVPAKPLILVVLTEDVAEDP